MSRYVPKGKKPDIVKPFNMMDLRNQNWYVRIPKDVLEWIVGHDYKINCYFGGFGYDETLPSYYGSHNNTSLVWPNGKITYNPTLAERRKFYARCPEMRFCGADDYDEYVKGAREYGFNYKCKGTDDYDPKLDCDYVRCLVNECYTYYITTDKNADKESLEYFKYIKFVVDLELAKYTNGEFDREDTTDEPPTPKEKICSVCGAKLYKRSKFCDMCGAKYSII